MTWLLCALGLHRWDDVTARWGAAGWARRCGRCGLHRDAR